MDLERQRRGMGWIPDYPDFRDYIEAILGVKSLLGKGKVRKSKKLPEKIDLREWCSPVEDQRRLSSCTTHAGVRIKERIEGGHAGVAVGYDDKLKIKNRE